MEEMQQITLDQWLAWKEDIREKLRETAGNFVHIGFRLKQIRDSGMLDGADDIFDFALKEYGLSKSSTSRFIAINEKFSEGGNSLELRAEYRSIGSSKLAEMLTLTDAECQLITEKTTVKEIRELKNFSRQQPSASEAEEADAGEEKILTPLQKCLVDYFKDKKEMLNEVIKETYDNNPQKAVELMNPSGYGTHKKGICFMFMYDFSAGVKAKLLTEQEPREMSWPDVLLEIYKIFGDIFENGEKDVHRAYYGSQEKAPDEIPEKRQEEAAGEETEIDASETEETAENQNAEGCGEDSVATSQQEEKTDENGGNTGTGEHSEESAEETGGEIEEQELDEEPEIIVREMEETAENQNADGTGGNSVATSQQKEEMEDERDASQDPAGSEDMEKWARGPRRAKKWDMIAEAAKELENFVYSYNRAEAANEEIPMVELKDAYNKAVNLAAGLESLIIGAERREKADE